MKKCIHCLVEKPLSEFYKHPQMVDGHLNTCKPCAKQKATENRNANLSRCQQYDRDRGNLHHRVEAQKSYMATANGKERRRLAGKAWAERNTLKRAAQIIVRKAIRGGKLVRQPCEVDGCPVKKTDAHHDDYSQPLAVRWLCRRHHADHHKALRAAGREP